MAFARTQVVTVAADTGSVTIAGAENKMVVFVFKQTGTSTFPTAVDYGGAALTIIGSRIYAGSTNGGLSLSAWYIDSPAAGAANVVISGGGTNIGFCALVYSDATTGVPASNTQGPNANDTVHTCSTAAAAAGALIHSALATNNDDDAVALGADETEIAHFTGAGSAGTESFLRVSEEVAAAAGSISTTFDNDGDGTWTSYSAMFAVAVEAAAAESRPRVTNVSQAVHRSYSW